MPLSLQISFDINLRCFDTEYRLHQDRALKDGEYYGVGQVIMSEDQGSMMMLIDDCISLWSRMLLNTADTNNKVLNNVISLQKNCIRWVQDLRFSFRRLRREGYQKQGDKSDQISEWYKVALLILQSMELLHTDLSICSPCMA